MSASLVNPGSQIPVALTLESKRNDRYPVAYIYKRLGGDLIAEVNLSRNPSLPNGEYLPDVETPMISQQVVVRYDVYTDEERSNISTTDLPAVDFFIPDTGGGSNQGPTGQLMDFTIDKEKETEFQFQNNEANFDIGSNEVDFSIEENDLDFKIEQNEIEFTFECEVLDG